MCGICGFTWEEPRVVQAMADEIAHRGPDQDGYHCTPGISLGHRRLSIIDLSENGRQPIANENGDLWLMHNGEIYNFRQVRQWLEGRGHVFRSHSDSEVILHAYEEEGADCLKRLNGMFAIALWDARRQRLLLARDRLGEKPLYYCQAGDQLVFASEIKALLKNPRVPRQVDETALDCFLGFEFIPAPLTAFAAIRALPAGHLLEWENGVARVRPYWRLGQQSEERPEKEWRDELRAHLERAVRIRLESDVPLGAFLSGGIDSSTVVAMMRRASNSPIRTFALGYKESGFSEFGYAQKVARHFGTEHSELLIDPITPEIIEKAVWHLDQPFSEFSVLPYFLICRKAREHVTVCLSGEGGDEVFVGYDRFKASRADRYLSRLPAPLRRAAGSLAASLPDRPQKKGALNSLRRFFQGADLARRRPYALAVFPHGGTGERPLPRARWRGDPGRHAGLGRPRRPGIRGTGRPGAGDLRGDPLHDAGEPADEGGQDEHGLRPGDPRPPDRPRAGGVRRPHPRPAQAGRLDDQGHIEEDHGRHPAAGDRLPAQARLQFSHQALAARRPVGLYGGRAERIGLCSRTLPCPGGRSPGRRAPLREQEP